MTTKHSLSHTPVLCPELLANLRPQAGHICIDATLGGEGGHTEGLLTAVKKNGRVIAIDRDLTALDLAQKKFANQLTSKQLVLCHNRFSQIATIARQLAVAGRVNCICADLGFSSMQIDDGQRGFSFRRCGPLDMRMDRKDKVTAYDIVNTASATELKTIISRYGEEPRTSAIVERIIARRQRQPIVTTSDLSEICCQVIPTSRGHLHPATRVFQALRIAVNDELNELQKFLTASFPLLTVGGRLAVISFHSLEDRLVKRYFHRLAGQRPADLRRLPIDTQPQARIIRPFPIQPSTEELYNNRRARSAKLRVIEKLSSCCR